MQNILENNPDIGRLQIQVFDREIGMPIVDARISIVVRNGGNVIEELVTNASGKTPMVDLWAPPVDYSMQPRSPRPYSEFDLYAEAQGFHPVLVEGAQILPNCTALQQIRMEPEVIGDQVQDIYIEPHTLYGIFPPKIPEEEVKPLPPSLGFAVLPQPVVPEFVIVHEGVPTDASARNFWVPFPDYIKNAASCEVYATWPRECLRANVLAILSFTLNRVYTEWYRGQGFDFTITNSTAYDQSYVHERNIYEEIANIVDEIFTTFITRPNIRQPLFTQYCDGSRVRCPNWLEQWGSKELGERGYNAIDILKNYYGQDIFLMQAQRVAGVPQSYPGEPLYYGVVGPNVTVIQEQLNAISNNYPAINKIRVDGSFGDQTLSAVETFQAVFNLPVTGIVDFSTWYKISNIYVAVTRMAELF